MKTSSVILLFFVYSALNCQIPQITFEANFNDGLMTLEGDNPSQSSGLDLVQGIIGNGVSIDNNDVLQYAITDNINSQEGSLSLWVNPSWDPGGVLYRIFVLGDDPRNFEIHMDEAPTLAFAANTSQVEGNPIKIVFADGSNWKKNHWYFLTYTWNAEFIKIYVNGQWAGESDVGYTLPLTTDPAFHIGSFWGENSFEGIIDELKIYDGPLNEQEVFEVYEDYLLSLPQSNALSVIDLFERDITDLALTLVDWEGPVRNPAMKYYIKGNEELEYPIFIDMSSKEGRAYFNLPSHSSKNGPSKTLELTGPESMQSFLMSYYMDEDFEDDEFELDFIYNLNGIPSRQTIPVHVVDQDYERELSYPITVDYTEVVDPFMQDEDVQKVITGAAEDWLYYVNGEGIDTVPAGDSWLDIGGNDHNFPEKRATNADPYKGYYLFAYENTNNVGPCFCSTGFPNRNLLNSRNGEEAPLPRIGGLHINQYGQAYESEPTGWEIVSPYDNWTFEGYIGTDLYFLAKHEIGHALVFEEIPLYKKAQQRLGFVSPALTEYYGDTIVPLLPESTAHLFGLIDPASQTTPYGGGVDDPIMPTGREMLTKLDILIMESVGYSLRENDVTRPVGLKYSAPLEGVVNQSFSVQLIEEGGIPVYYTILEEGPLPPGLNFDSNTGLISGSPEVSGTYPIKFRVKDYTEGHSGVVTEASIKIIKEGSAAAELITFDIDNQIGDTEINVTEGTINVKMPEETDLSSLAPIISISEGAIIDPPSGEPQDFTSPIIYTITSENQEVSSSWTAMVEKETTSSVDHPSLDFLNFFPIPFTDHITIRLELNESKDVEVFFITPDGRVAMNRKLGQSRKWEESFNTKDLIPGIHFIRIHGDGELIAIKKIMKM